MPRPRSRSIFPRVSASSAVLAWASKPVKPTAAMLSSRSLIVISTASRGSFNSAHILYCVRKRGGLEVPSFTTLQKSVMVSPRWLENDLSRENFFFRQRAADLRDGIVIVLDVITALHPRQRAMVSIFFKIIEKDDCTSIQPCLAFNMFVDRCVRLSRANQMAGETIGQLIQRQAMGMRSDPTCFANGWNWCWTDRRWRYPAAVSSSISSGTPV